MFFIGIFGIDQKEKHIGTYNNAICPACGALTRFEVYKSYSFFHIFFIPVFRWNIKYFVKSVCCSSIYELDPEIGRQYESGNSPDIKTEHLNMMNGYLPYKICVNCRARVESRYSYCPYCGSKL